MALTQNQVVECEDDLYDDAILLGEKLMIVRTCLGPDMLLTVDKDMGDAAAFAVDQLKNCLLNDDDTNQLGKLMGKTAFRASVLEYIPSAPTNLRIETPNLK